MAKTLAAGLAILALLVAHPRASAGRSSSRPGGPDPLAEEIARWKAYAARSTLRGEIWDQVKGGGEPLLRRAEAALHDGRRLLALHRLAVAREGFAAAHYLYSQPEEVREDAARFEAEWRRVGEVLSVGPALAPGTLASLAPAAVRAIGEAALAQVRVYHGASLDYAKSTGNDSGLYYVGAALAQRELAAFLEGLPAEGAGDALPLRALGADLDRLESEILAAYRPPASLDRHSEFIRASAALKEARELDALGLRHGALLRYLLAVQRIAPVASTGAAEPEAAAIEARLREHAACLAGPLDHSIGRLFLETAEALAGGGEEGDPRSARGIAEQVLPRYFAALEPTPPAAPRPEPRATVTLVRWPYT